MAVAYDRYEIAVAVGLILFLVLHFLTPLEHRIGAGDAGSPTDRGEEAGKVD
jgi:hypothetical protein